jgi:hypothetical protein
MICHGWANSFSQVLLRSHCITRRSYVLPLLRLLLQSLVVVLVFFPTRCVIVPFIIERTEKLKQMQIHKVVWSKRQAHGEWCKLQWPSILPVLFCAVTSVVFCVLVRNQPKSVRMRIRERKLISGVNWWGALKQKDVKQTGAKTSYPFSVWLCTRVAASGGSLIYATGFHINTSVSLKQLHVQMYFVEVALSLQQGRLIKSQQVSFRVLYIN